MQYYFILAKIMYIYIYIHLEEYILRDPWSSLGGGIWTFYFFIFAYLFFPHNDLRCSYTTVVIRKD